MDPSLLPKYMEGWEVPSSIRERIPLVSHQLIDENSFPRLQMSHPKPPLIKFSLSIIIRTHILHPPSTQSPYKQQQSGSRFFPALPSFQTIFTMKPEPPCKTEQTDHTRLCFSLKIKCTQKRVLKASVCVTPLRVKEATGPLWCHKVWETLGLRWRRQDGTFFQSPHACIAWSQATEPDPRTERKEVEGEFAAERKDLK